MVNLSLENIEIKADGKTHEIKNRGDIESAISFFSQLLEWYISITESAPSISFSVTDHVHGTDHATVTKIECVSPETTVDYVLLGLNFLGRPARFEELLRPVLHMGWESAAKNDERRVRLIEVAARRHPELTQVRRGVVRPTQQGNQRLVELGQTPKMAGVTSSAPITHTRRRRGGNSHTPSLSPTDEEALVYIRTLYQNPQYYPTTTELKDDMKRLGWTTGSKNERDRVYQVLHKLSGEFTLVGGRWHWTPPPGNGYKLLPKDQVYALSTLERAWNTN